MHNKVDRITNFNLHSHPLTASALSSLR